MNELNNNSTSLSFDAIFDTITCPECHLFWLKEYVPQYCPKCGTKVSNNAGNGMENMVGLIKKANLPINILECPQCRLRYPEVEDRTLRKCLQCQIPLVNTSPITNFLRKIVWHSMLLIKFIASRF